MKKTIFTIFLSTGISWGAQAMDQEGVRRLQPTMPGPADDVVSTTSSSQAGPDTAEEALPSVAGLSIDDEQVSGEERARLKKAAQNKKKREKQKLKARQKKAENSGDAQAASSDVPSAPSSNPGSAQQVPPQSGLNFFEAAEELSDRIRSEQGDDSLSDENFLKLMTAKLGPAEGAHQFSKIRNAFANAMHSNVFANFEHNDDADKGNN